MESPRDLTASGRAADTDSATHKDQKKGQPILTKDAEPQVMNWSEVLVLELLLLPVTQGLAIASSKLSCRRSQSWGLLSIALSRVMLNYLVSDATPTRKVKH